MKMRKIKNKHVHWTYTVQINPTDRKEDKPKIV